jgi:tetratricopeptide (TPR) repeat protein
MHILFVILMMFPSPDWPAEERKTTEKPSEVKFELLLTDAVHAFYHADWAYSDSLLVELSGMEPNDARVHFFRSMIPFWSYFFGGNDPEYAGRFLEMSERAIKVSEDRLKKAPSDTSMVLLLSGLYGYRSLVAADQKEYRTAIRSGMTGFTYTRQLLSLNTNDPNALLGRGVFDYMTGSVPRELRWMTNMFGLSGSKEEGFKRLEEAASSNSYVSNDARMFLCYLYDRDGRYHDALRVSKTLAEDFPGNAIFRYYYAHSLEKTGDIAGAIDSYNMVLEMQKPELESLREKAEIKIKDLAGL